MRYFLCALAIIFLAGAAARFGPGDCAVGVVDVNQVFEKSTKWQAMTKVLEARKEECQKKLDALSQEVETLRASLEKADRDSSEFTRVQAALIEKEAFLGSTSQQFELELDRADGSNYDGFVAELDATIAAIAKELGLTLVLQRKLDTSEGEWRSVLFADPRADLTVRVVERLNATRDKK